MEIPGEADNGPEMRAYQMALEKAPEDQTSKTH